MEGVPRWSGLASQGREDGPRKRGETHSLQKMLEAKSRAGMVESPTGSHSLSLTTSGVWEERDPY